MASNIITGDELSQFRSLSVKKKVDCMELYLIGSNGYKYNMQEVGERVFGNVNYSYTVSMIHRCYNFAGQNSGKYRNGCNFEKTYGYRVTRKDIEAFVRKYPNGTFNNGVTFENFLRARVNNVKKTTQKSVQKRQTMVRKKQYNSKTNNYANFDRFTEEEQVKMVMLATGGMAALILVIMFLSGKLLEHWGIALILFLYMAGAFGACKR